MTAANTPKRGIVLWLGAAFALEATIYSAITPLLPHYAARFGLSKTSVGVLTATYPAGVIIGAVFGAVLARKVGVRAATVAALLALSASTVVFGLARTTVTLDLARLGQGTASGAMWSATLAWLFLSAGRRRGTALGAATSAAVIGIMAGPLVGTTAAEVGPAPVYCALAVSILALAVVFSQLASPAPITIPSGSASRTLRRVDVIVGVWLVLFSGYVLGASNTLVPLRLAQLGASQVAIGATFLVAAVLSAGVSPPIGALVDRRGPALPVLAGLTIMTASSLALGLADVAVIVAGLTIALNGFSLLAVWIPAMAVLANGVEVGGASAAFAAATINVSVSVGEVLGSPVSASLSAATGSDTLPFSVIVGASAAALVFLWSARARVLSGEAVETV